MTSERAWVWIPWQKVETRFIWTPLEETATSKHQLYSSFFSLIYMTTIWFHYCVMMFIWCDMFSPIWLANSCEWNYFVICCYFSLSYVQVSEHDNEQIVICQGGSERCWGPFFEFWIKNRFLGCGLTHGSHNHAATTMSSGATKVAREQEIVEEDDADKCRRREDTVEDGEKNS